MATRVLVIWILLLQIMWTGVFLFFRGHFVPKDNSQEKIQALESKLHHAERLLAKEDLNFREYKDAVAFSGVKIQDTTSWTDSKRMVASLMADPEFKTPIELPLGKERFEKGRKLFLAGEYNRAAQIFADVIIEHPENINVPQASFLLSESYFYSGRLDESVKAINDLITHYPETEYAGYALVRLGKIYERVERLEDAADIYRTVIKNFTKSKSAEIAQHQLKELPL